MRDKSCCRHTSRLWCLLQACVWARRCQLPRRSQSLKKEYCLWTFKAWNVELEDVFKEQISLVWHLGNYFKNSYPWFSSGCSFKITDSRAEHNVHVASILLFLKKKKPSSSFSNLRLPQGCTLTFITTVCTVPFFFFFFFQERHKTSSLSTIFISTRSFCKHWNCHLQKKKDLSWKTSEDNSLRFRQGKRGF